MAKTENSYMENCEFLYTTNCYIIKRAKYHNEAQSDCRYHITAYIKELNEIVSGNFRHDYLYRVTCGEYFNGDVATITIVFKNGKAKIRSVLL